MTDAIQLRTIEFEGTDSGPHLLITGGVHGNEFTPMAAIRKLSKLIDANVLTGRLTLVPIVNRAAFLNGARTAEDGLDLARTCPGRCDGSVTERTAVALSELIRSADYYVDLHTGSSTESLSPMSGYVLHKSEEILNKQREMARAFNLPIIWGTSATLEGRSLSVARDANVPAIYTEYMGSGMCDADGVQDYVDGCLNVMASLGMIERTLPDSAIEHVVEDDRPDSGHMQVQNPSPITGFFESYAKLGDTIRAGECIGMAIDLNDDTAIPVVAGHEGIVLGLRTFSRVLKGESVAVLIETNAGKTKTSSKR